MFIKFSKQYVYILNTKLSYNNLVTFTDVYLVILFKICIILLTFCIIVLTLIVLSSVFVTNWPNIFILFVCEILC